MSSTTSFSRDNLDAALRNSSPEDFNNLLNNETFLTSEGLYDAAVSIINSYQDVKDMPALKRAYAILENTHVKSLPINQTGILGYLKSFVSGYEGAKQKSQQIITSNFSDYLQVVVTQETTGIDLEKKLVKHDKHIEVFLKELGIPDSEWDELKSLVAQRRESEAIGQWNSIIAQLRGNISAFQRVGTIEIEKFLLENTNVGNLLHVNTALEKAFLNVLPVLSKSTIPSTYPDEWAKLQTSLLKGDSAAFSALLEKTVNEQKPYGAISSKLSHVINDALAKEGLLPLNSSVQVVSQTSSPQQAQTLVLPELGFAHGKIVPVKIEQDNYLISIAPRSSGIENYFNVAAELGAEVIVDLRNELIMHLFPLREGEERNNIKLLKSDAQNIPGSKQKLIRLTVETTLKDGSKKTFQILRAPDWIQDEPDPVALTYLSSEVAKLEEHIKGKVLILSLNKERSSGFILYHHISKEKENPLHLLDEPQAADYKAFVLNAFQGSPSSYYDKDAAWNKDIDTRLEKEHALGEKLQRFTAGLNPTDKYQVLYFMLNKDSDIKLTIFIHAEEITFKQIEERYLQKFPSSTAPTLETLLLYTTQKDLFETLFPEINEYEFEYKMWENDLKAAGKPHDVNSVINTIKLWDGTISSLNISLELHKSVENRLKNNPGLMNKLVESGNEIALVHFVPLLDLLEPKDIEVLDPKIFKALDEFESEDPPFLATNLKRQGQNNILGVGTLEHWEAITEDQWNALKTTRYFRNLPTEFKKQLITKFPGEVPAEVSNQTTAESKKAASDIKDFLTKMVASSIEDAIRQIEQYHSLDFDKALPFFKKYGRYITKFNESNQILRQRVELIKCCPNLKHVFIHGGSLIEDPIVKDLFLSFLKTVGDLQNLEEMAIDFKNAGKEEMDLLFSQPKPKLRRLSFGINSVCKFTPEGFETLISELPKFKELKILTFLKPNFSPEQLDRITAAIGKETKLRIDS